MKVIININDLIELKEIYRKFENVEIGGTLIGYRSEDEYIITNIIYDNYIGENLKKYSYIRNIENLKDKMISCINSNKGIDYIGEWHTHPNNKSIYSKTDEKTMENLVEDFNELLLLICGIDEVSAYIFKKNNFVKKLVIEERENDSE